MSCLGGLTLPAAGTGQRPEGRCVARLDARSALTEWAIRRTHSLEGRPRGD